MQPPSLFLRLIIGDISVTLPYKEDRYIGLSLCVCVCSVDYVVYRVSYRADYEQFKKFHTVLMCVLAVLSLTFHNSM